MKPKKKAGKQRRTAVRKPMPKPTQAHKDRMATILEKLWEDLRREGFEV